MNRRIRPRESAFLAALESTGIVSHAAKAAEVRRRTVYDHLRHNCTGRPVLLEPTCKGLTPLASA